MDENISTLDKEIDGIKDIISKLLINQDDSFERIYDINFFREHFNNFIFLSYYHDIIQSPTPSVELHVFAFFKIEHIVSHYSRNWQFKDYSEICSWLIQYAVTFSDYIVDSPKALIVLYVRCFMSIVNMATVKYPFSQEFWDAAVQLAVTVYSNKSSLSYVALAMLTEMVKSAEEKERSETMEKKKNFQIEKNRQTIYDFSLQILEVCYEGQISQNGENQESVDDRRLINRAFKTVLSLSDLARSSQLRLFLAYSLVVEKKDNPLAMCAACLMEGKDELDGSEGEVDRSAVSAVEEAVLSAGPNGRSQLQDSMESDVTILYFTRFVLLMMNRGVKFSLLFAVGLAAFAQEFVSSDSVVYSSESVLNLIEFFTLFEGNGYEQPPPNLQETVFESVMKAASTDTKRFVQHFGLGQPDEERLTSLFASLFLPNFQEIVEEIKGQIEGCIREKENEKTREAASCVFRFFVRVIEHLVSAQMKHKREEGVADTLRFLMAIQSEVIVPIISSHQENQMFDQADVMAVLMFDSMLAHFDEIDAFSTLSPADYSDFLKEIVAVCHSVVTSFGIETEQAELSMSILAAILQRKESSVLIDTDWMLDEMRKLEFDVNSLESFENFESFIESLFFSELSHVDPRIDSIVSYVTDGLDDLVELFESIDNDTEIKEKKAQLAPSAFARMLAGVSGILGGFDKFCGGGEVLIHQKTVEGQNELEFGRSIIDLLCPDIFDALTDLIEQITLTDISSFTTPCALIFMRKFARVLRRDFFESSAMHANEVFVDFSTLLRRFIERARFSIASIDSEAASKGVDESVFEHRNLMVATVSICARCAAELLNSDAVCFGAFLLYDDPAYIELVNAAVDCCDFIGAASIIESGAVSSYDFGLGSEFDIVSTFTSLAESFFSIHLHLLVGRPECEKFDTFFASSLRLITVIPGGYKLFSIVVHELYKMAAFDGFNCDAAIGVSEQVEAAVSRLADEVFIGFHSSGDDEVISDSSLFAEFCCMSVEFAQGLEARLMPACKKLRQREVAAVIAEICEASPAHDVERLKDLFIKLHKIWFK